MVLDLFNESTLFDDDIFAESLEPEIENAETIPVKEGESITDAYYRITLENVQNYNNIMNSVAIAEMAYMEKNNTDKVEYEAVDVKAFGDTIVGYVSRAWAKIKGLFESAIEAIKKVFTRDLVAEYEKAIKDGKVNANTTITVKKGVRIDNIGVIPSKVDAALNKHVKGIMVDTKNISKDTADTKAKDWKDNKKDKLKQMRGSVLAAFGGSATGCESKEFGSELTKVVATEIEGETKITLGEAYNHAKHDISVKDLKKAFKATEKSFNDMMKVAKSTKKDARKDKADAVVTASAMNISIIKECISVLNATSHQVIKLAGRKAQMYRAVLKKGLSKKNSDSSKDDKKDDKKSTNESAGLICDLI